MNNSSVVLECPGETLFLGDIGKEIYKRHIQPHLTDGYKVVKVSHHGTKDYYAPDLPEAKVYLVSNSGIWRTDWGIYEEYRKNCPNQMQCTNTEARRCMSTQPICTRCRINPAKVLGNGNRVIDVNKL